MDGRGADPVAVGRTAVPIPGTVPHDGAEPIPDPGHPEGPETTPGPAPGTENTRGPDLLIDGPAVAPRLGGLAQGALLETEREEVRSCAVLVPPRIAMPPPPILRLEAPYLLLGWNKVHLM